MSNFESHGRLGRTAARLVTGIALAAFAAGAYLGKSEPGDQEDDRHQPLGAELSLLNEGYLASIEQLRIKSFHLTYRMPRSPEDAARFQLPAPFQFWGLALIHQDGTLQLQSRLPAGPSTSGFQAHHIEALPRKLDVDALKRDGITAFTLPRDTAGRRQYLGFVFWGRPLSREGLAGRAVLALVDPGEVFGTLERIAPEFTELSRRAYLLSSDGIVLAHTQNGHVGSDFSSMETTRESLETVLAGALREVTTDGKGIDGIPVRAVFRRVGSLPIAAVLEQVTTDPRGAGFRATIQRFWKDSSESVATAGLFLVLIIAGGTLLFRRKMDPAPAAALPSAGFTFPKSSLRTDAAALQAEMAFEQDEDAPAESPDPVPLEEVASSVTIKDPPRFAGKPEADSAAGPALPVLEALVGMPARDGADQPAESADSRRTRLPSEPEGNHTFKLVGKFAAEAGRLKDSRLVTALLTKTAAQLCESPILYFAYSEALGTAILKEDAGFTDGEAPVSMSFPIDRKALVKITQFARSGKIASLAQYPPLTNIVLTRLGVAAFEAWAVTSGTPDPRLLGVLVIVRSGVHSVQHRRSIVGMMKASAGLIQNEHTQPPV